MGAFAPEQFTVMVSELSGLMQLLQKIPLLGAFVEPTVLALQDHQLKHRHTRGIVQILPPLQLMENAFLQHPWRAASLLTKV